MNVSREVTVPNLLISAYIYAAKSAITCYREGIAIDISDRGTTI